MTHFVDYPRHARAGIRVNREKASSPVIASLPLTGMALHDPAEWIPEFDAWASRACVYVDFAFGGVGALHAAFCEWCVRNRSVPCTRDVFEHLLNDRGFLVCDALVSALVLKKDLEMMTA
jgi:hypothetical protein